MSIERGTAYKPVPVLQADTTLSQANPVSGTQYAVLATNINVRIWAASAYSEWTVQPSPIELHFTIDGNTLTHAKANPVTATHYIAQLNAQGSEIQGNMDIYTALGYSLIARSIMIEGRSVAAVAEITGGTVQLLTARIKWSKW